MLRVFDQDTQLIGLTIGVYQVSQKLKILPRGHQKDDFQSTENEEDGFLTAASSSEDEGQQTWNGTKPFETPSSIELFPVTLKIFLVQTFLKLASTQNFQLTFQVGAIQCLSIVTSYRMKYWATLSHHFLDQLRSIVHQIGN